MSSFNNFGQGGFGGNGSFRGTPFNSSSYGASDGVWKGIKDSFKEGSDLIKLIYINIAVFLILKILFIISFLLGIENLSAYAIDLLAVPSDTVSFIAKPWTVISYMFVHEGFLHLLFNMLWLFWFGKLFSENLTKARLSAVYILGGLTGAAIYMLSYNLFPAFQEVKYESIAIGASASVMAIVFAVAFYNPNYRLYLFLIGPVKLIYIALFSVLIDVISLPSGNAGGHIAHLGGALYGYLFAINYRNNRDISSFFVGVMDSIVSFFKRLFSSKPRMKVHKGEYSTRNMSDKDYNATKRQEQDKINKILDKISKSGYESLSKDEKELLFRSGRN